MHSFDNGQSTKAKRDNWAQLVKLFRKIGLPDLITENEAHWIASLEEGAAVNFLCKAYEVLTQRKVSLQTKPPTLNKEPGYLRDNGLAKVRKALQHNDLQEGYNMQKSSKIIASVLDEHESGLQEERFTDPDRYSVQGGNSVANRSQSSTSPKRSTMVSSRDDIPVVTAKEIQVRQLDRNAAPQRRDVGATNRPGGGGSVGGGNSPGRERDSSPRPVSPAGSEKVSANRSLLSNDRGDGSIASERMGSIGSQSRLAAPTMAHIPSGQLIPENSLSLLNACIARIMNAQDLSCWSNRLDPFSNFITAVEILANGADVDSIIADTLQEIENSAGMLADACAVTPKQFWKVSDLFCTVIIRAPYESLTYSAGIRAFQTIGRAITARDPFSSLAMFMDFSMFKLANITIRHAQKRLGILQLLHAFSPANPESHVQCIKRLQGIITQLPDFIACLNVLALQEESMNELLLDLYSYYATIGLGQPSPKIRAGSIAMLRALLPEGETVVAKNLLHLERMVNGEQCWWEERAQLIALAGQFLTLQAKKERNRQEDSGAANGSRNQDSDEVQAGVRCAKRVLAQLMDSIEDDNSSQWLWTTQQLAGAVGYTADIDQLFVAGLEHLSLKDLRFTLGLQQSTSDRDGFEASDKSESARVIRLPSCTGLPYDLKPASQGWHSLSLAHMIETIATRDSLDRFSPLQLQILFASVRSRMDATGLSDSCLAGQWLDVYNQLKDFIFIGVCDALSVVSSLGLLSAYMFHSELRDSILQDSRFIGLFRLLYSNDSGLSPEDANACQYIFESFLRDVFRSGKPYDRSIYQVLSQFSKTSPSIFSSAPSLQRVLKEFSSSLN